MGLKDNQLSLNGSQQTILDMFRITAALFVMVGHSFSYYKYTIFKDQTFFPYLQNIGVVLFFLLSGFLTAFSLNRSNKNHNYTFRDFLKHKAVRISKEYIPGLLIIAVIDAISIELNGERYPYYQAYNVKQFVSNALMLHNMGPNSMLGKLFIPFGSGRPLWTLSVEWWLYMLYGAMFLSIRNKKTVSIANILGFSVIVFMSSNYLITGRGQGLGFVFALGVLGYYVYRLIRQSVAIIIFCSSFMIYIAYGIMFKEAYTVYSFIILWLVFVSALSMGGIAQIQTRNALLAYASKSTFMLYLIHYSIIDLLFHLDNSWNLYVRFIMGIIVSLSVSFIAYYVFGYKDLTGTAFRLFKKKTGKNTDEEVQKNANTITEIEELRPELEAFADSMVSLSVATRELADKLASIDIGDNP